MATLLYTKKLIASESKVTIATNRKADLHDFSSSSCKIVRLPFSDLRNGKATLIFLQNSIHRKLRQHAISNDVAYIPGKMIFLAPWLKKVNPSLKVIVHLHDYQLICPHGSLINMLKHGTCEYIWSDFDCLKCTYRFLRADKRGIVNRAVGTATTAIWKHSSNIKDIIDAVDLFLTVSHNQRDLIKGNLDEYATQFSSKCQTLYNPIDVTVDYVPPEFEEQKRVCFGFFGGDRFVKGYSHTIDLFNSLSDKSAKKLIASRISFPLSNEKFEFYGNLDSKQMIEAYKRIWIVLFTSVMEETSSYIVVDSQLRGRPVIATPVGGVSENIVKPDFTGNLISIGDNAKFAQLVEHYYGMLKSNSRDYTREISSSSREFFLQRTISSYAKFSELVN